MKKLSFLLALTAVFGLAFTNPASEVVTMSVDTDESYVTWRAYKVTGKHYGKVKLKSGNLEYTDGMLSGGMFVMDMTTISVDDISGNMADKLRGHLMSDDFFSVEKHPEATFEITKVVSRGKPGDYRITGNLTIKDYTEEIRFNAMMEEADGMATGKADIKLDRTNYDIRYRSGTFFQNLGDKTIYDEFDLEVNLVATK